MQNIAQNIHKLYKLHKIIAKNLQENCSFTIRKFFKFTFEIQSEFLNIF